MKNKLVNVVTFIINYILVFILCNLKNVVLVLIGKKTIENLNFFSTIILISTILSFIIIYLFKNGKIKNKKIFFSFIIHIVLITLVSGIFTSFNIIPFVLLYLFLMLSCFSFMLISNKCFEISLCISFSIIILFSFIIGILGLLNILKYLIVLISMILIIYNMIYYKENKNKYVKCINEYFSITHIIFIILFYISIFANIGMYVNSWDEYSFWAYDAKALIYSSKFSVSKLNVERPSSYPPLLSVWHYIVSIFNNGFSESNLYIGLNIFIYIYFMPALYWLKNKNLLTIILGSICIFFGCTLFDGIYKYSSLYADLAITSVFTSCIIINDIMNVKQNNNSKFRSIFLYLLLIILCLIKPNGFIIAMVLVFIISFKNFINDYRITKNLIIDYVKYVFKKYLKYILLIILVFLLWNIYYRFLGSNNDFYKFILLPNSLKSDISLKLNANFIINFYNGIIKSFDCKQIVLLVSLNLYQYIIIMFLGIGTILYFENGKNIKKALKQLSSYILGYIAFFTLTVLSLFIAFSYYEAENLASFGRYLNWFHVGYFIYVIAALSKEQVGCNKKNNIFVNFIYIIILLSISFNNTFYFITNYPDRKNTENIYNERNNKFYLLKKYTEKNSKVYIIDQKDTDGIMAMWYARYYTFPRKTNASSEAINWKIRTRKNIDDLQDWGLTARQWANHLLEYNFDYVFLYTFDNEFYNTIKDCGEFI